MLDENNDEIREIVNQELIDSLEETCEQMAAWKNYTIDFPEDSGDEYSEIDEELSKEVAETPGFIVQEMSLIEKIVYEAMEKLLKSRYQGFKKGISNFLR